MEYRYVAISISLLLCILNASFSIPTPTSVFIVQIQNLMYDPLFAGCHLNGRSLPKKELKIGKQANFTVHLGSTEIETMTCDLRSGDYHGSFVMFDSLNWNVSSYCDPDSLCQWKVVPEGICLAHALNCSVLHFWPKPTA
nr:hypothetical protein A4A49_18824 [Ipomoea batatas]GMD80492.1 hypothetical protein A4A49_18824 [Ipomoea batatas]